MAGISERKDEALDLREVRCGACGESGSKVFGFIGLMTVQAVCWFVIGYLFGI